MLTDCGPQYESTSYNMLSFPPPFSLSSLTRERKLFFFFCSRMVYHLLFFSLLQDNVVNYRNRFSAFGPESSGSLPLPRPVGMSGELCNLHIIMWDWELFPSPPTFLFPLLGINRSPFPPSFRRSRLMRNKQLPFPLFLQPYASGNCSNCRIAKNETKYLLPSSALPRTRRYSSLLSSDMPVKPCWICFLAPVFLRVWRQQAHSPKSK